jgi:hypothetical protein
MERNADRFKSASTQNRSLRSILSTAGLIRPGKLLTLGSGPGMAMRWFALMSGVWGSLLVFSTPCLGARVKHSSTWWNGLPSSLGPLARSDYSASGMTEALHHLCQIHRRLTLIATTQAVSGASLPGNQKDWPPSSHGRACQTTTATAAAREVFCQTPSSSSGGTGKSSRTNTVLLDELRENGVQIPSKAISRMPSLQPTVRTKRLIMPRTGIATSLTTPPRSTISGMSKFRC